jgi:hypothetical protein
LLGGRKGNVVVGTLVSFVLGFWFHSWVIGVPVFGSSACRSSKRSSG